VTSETLVHDAAGLSEETARLLRVGGLDAGAVVRAVRAALEEDFRYGPDVTSAATVAGRTVTADVVAREAGVLAGIPVALAVLDLIGPLVAAAPGGEEDGAAAGLGATGLPAPGVAATGLTATVLTADGSAVAAGDAVLRVSGPAPAVLGAERTMLNFLTHLSGIATATRAWADAIAGTGAVVRDTRKTTPGLRALEKYAVRCGGGQNHRMGLGDAALIKDNHVAAAGGVAAAVTAVRAAATALAGAAAVRAGAAARVEGVPAVEDGLVIEVECDSVAQVREALDAGARFLLLDNMGTDALRAAVAVAREYDGVRLEASGGLRLSNAREVAATGVDYLAVGALTHSARALDLGLDYAGAG
jgi:nicotinate-nucleotide pyrophosphorylase (carboxylating)